MLWIAWLIIVFYKVPGTFDCESYHDLPGQCYQDLIECCFFSTSDRICLLRRRQWRFDCITATPDVKIQGTGKSKSAIKGENFQLNCTVQGHTYGTDHIKWVHFNESDGKNNTLLDAPWSSLVLCKEEQDEIGGRRCHLDSNDSRISFKRDHEFEKYVNSANHSSGHPQNMISSILEINNVLDEDRGSYYCIAANGVGENGHSVIVRVKGIVFCGFSWRTSRERDYPLRPAAARSCVSVSHHFVCSRRWGLSEKCGKVVHKYGKAARW